jgi:hypothetical protein
MLQLSTCRPVDCAIDTSSAYQRILPSVDDCTDLQLSDVAEDGFHHGPANSSPSQRFDSFGCASGWTNFTSAFEGDKTSKGWISEAIVPIALSLE